MQLRTKVVGAAGIAALVAAGGFAFTASNTVLPKNLGYGETNVSGITTTSTSYNVSTTDTSKLDSIDFGAAQGALAAATSHGEKLKVELKSGSGTTPVATSSDCTQADTDPYAINCAFSSDPNIKHYELRQARASS